MEFVKAGVDVSRLISHCLQPISLFTHQQVTVLFCGIRPFHARALKHSLTHLLDLYAFCVNYKDSLETVAWRNQYYRFMCAAVLESLGAPVGKIHFVDASAYDLRRDIAIQNYRLAALTDLGDIQNSGDEYRYSTKVSVMLCPGMVALAEEYLDADFQYGGEDQARWGYPPWHYFESC